MKNWVEITKMGRFFQSALFDRAGYATAMCTHACPQKQQKVGVFFRFFFFFFFSE